MVVSSILWPYYSDKRNRQKVYIRISGGGVKSYIPTKIKVTKKQWNAGRVRASNPLADTYNQIIQTLIINTERIYFQEVIIGRKLTASELKERVLLGDVQTRSFTEFAVEFKELKGNQQYQRMLRVTLENMQLFAKKTDISFNEITFSWLSKFEGYLANTVGNEPGTINKKMKHIKRIWNYATKCSEVVKNIPFPFTSYKIPDPQTKLVVALNDGEIGMLETAPHYSDPMHHARNIFLIGYYLYGLRISDRLLLRWDAIINGSVNLETKKTGKSMRIIICRQAWDIINQYDRSQPYIFPYMNEAKEDPHTTKEIDRQTAKINKQLRKLAEMCGIEKRVTTHVARHTFANKLRLSGISKELAAKCLGVSEQTAGGYMGQFTDQEQEEVAGIIFGG